MTIELPQVVAINGSNERSKQHPGSEDAGLRSSFILRSTKCCIYLGPAAIGLAMPLFHRAAMSFDHNDILER